jgi:hypothetical protein
MSVKYNSAYIKVKLSRLKATCKPLMQKKKHRTKKSGTKKGKLLSKKASAILTANKTSCLLIKNYYA